MLHLRGFLWLACAFLVGTEVRAQTTPSPEAQSASAKSPADQLVDQLEANAERYRSTLPSLTVRESIISKYLDFVVFGKRVVNAETLLRVSRKAPGGPLNESREFTTINGKQSLPSDKPTPFPILLLGPFANFPATFFGPQRPCFTFTLAPQSTSNAPLELSITFKAASASLPQCSAWANVTAVARIDPATHQLAHLERTAPRIPGAQKFQTLFESVDLAPARIGDKTFWLPTLVEAHVVVENTRREWIAHYSDYHQFAATSTILPAAPE